MPGIEQWDRGDAVFRNLSGKPLDHSISCGFINKAGQTRDVIDERYDRFAMVYVLRGNGHYEDDTGQARRLAPGDLFLRCPDRRHSTTIDPDSRWLECFASVRSAWHALFSELGLMRPDRVSWRVGERPEIPERIARHMRQLRESDTPLTNSTVEFELASLIRDMLCQHLELSAIDSPHRDQLETARSLIRARAADAKDLESMLRPIGLSYSRLRSLFRQAYGMSPGDYRIQVRIEQACALLQTTNRSIQEIADELGYADAFSFSKQFKQRTGTAPKHFREPRSEGRE